MYLFFPLFPLKSEPILKKTSVCCQGCLCASAAISQVGWGCGVPRTEATHIECCVSLGLPFTSFLSAAEFTLEWAGTVQDQLSLPHSPSDSHLQGSSSQCCVPDAALSPGRGEGAQAASQGALALLGICWKPEKARGEGFLPAPDWCSGGCRATRNHLWLP